jgi:predicted anti-sigma-YlaC factor YlaD
MGVVLPAECERARSRVSLGLDGELSQVEQASMRAHVGRCARCAEFAHDLERLKLVIRRTPLERPSQAVMPERRRSAGMRVLQLSAAAAAIAIAAGLGSLAGSLSSREPAAKTATGVRFASLDAGRPQARPGTRLQKSTAV